MIIASRLGASPATGRHAERRRRLADRLAIAAGELLPHMLDHLPAARDHLQRLRDILAESAQPPHPPQHRHLTGAGSTTRSRGQVLGEWLARRALADEGGHVGRACGGPVRRPISSSVAAVSASSSPSSICSINRAGAFGALAIKRMPKLGDLQLLVGDQRLVGPPARARPAATSARRASMSSGRGSESAATM